MMVTNSINPPSVPFMQTRPYDIIHGMKYDPHIHHRHSIRLQGYDYSRSGAYFVTIVSYRRESIFGDLVKGEMALNKLGRAVEYAWFDLPDHYSNVRLDEYCIMPNHVHCILVIDEEKLGESHPLSEIIRGFKTLSAKRINILRQTPGVPVWQRNYFEHIIRDEHEYTRIQSYIAANPDNWLEDDENMDSR